MRHLVFICGVEGTEKGAQEKFRKLLDSTFKEVVKNGFEEDQVNSALYQLELSRREISSGSLPYGLQILLSMAPGSLYKSDPLALSNVDEALANLKERIKDKNYLTGLVDKFFISNNHKVELEMVPDADLINKKEGELRKILDGLKSAMSNKEKMDIVNQAKNLADRQNAIPNKEVLPKLELNDVPKDVSFPKTKKLTTFGYSPTFYEQPTNGLTYNSVTKNLNIESQEELNSLMVLSALLGKVGTGDKDHMQLQKEISKISGGINVSNHFFTDKNNELKGNLTLSSKFLPKNSVQTTELIFEF